MATRVIRIGCPPLSFYAVQGAIVAEILRLSGRQCEVVPEFHDVAYPMLADGRIDLFVASWLPSGHAAFWKKYGQNAVQVGELFQDGRFFLGVPHVVAKDDVASIADLAGSDLERNIVSIQPGADTLTNRANKALDDYGLRAHGFNIEGQPEADWARQATEMCREGQRFVLALWQPCFLNAHLDVRRLEDPFGSMGVSDTGWITANAEFVDDADPLLMALLQRISLSLSNIASADARVVIDGFAPERAASEWIERNNDKVQNWLAKCSPAR